jgi:tRNA pseudouridine55 synthase
MTRRTSRGRDVTGVLLIDKPAGPTSHDVVARLRRSSGERRIGHTGTLDPRATGLLPLVLGQATRLASLLTSGDKTYEAVLRLGYATSTDDADGEPLGPAASRLPADADIEGALGAFRGTFEQRPPTHSAKKVAGHRAYDLARRDRPVTLTPVRVTVRELALLGRSGDEVRIRVTATAGFYVRGLARDLGERLGCGGHLGSLRRTRSGRLAVEDALPLDEAERLGPAVSARLLSPDAALPHLESVRLTAAGVNRARHGNAVGPEHLEGRAVPATGPTDAQPVKLLDSEGRLMALAHRRGGALHPVVVLG